MIIHVINIDGGSILESEGNTPVARYRYSVMTFQITFQWM